MSKPENSLLDFNTDKIVAALCKARVNFKPLKKNGWNPAFKSHYALLTDIQEATVEPLAKEGLILKHAPYRPKSKPEHVGVKTTLHHISGQKLDSIRFHARPDRDNVHGIVSIVTYLKRCNSEAILNLSGQDDDDGNVAANVSSNSSSSQQKPNSMQPIAGFMAPQESRPATKAPSQVKAGDYIVGFSKKYKGKKLSEIPEKELRSFMDWLTADSEKKGQAISGPAKEFMHMAETFLSASDELDIPFPPEPIGEDLDLQF